MRRISEARKRCSFGYGSAIGARAGPRLAPKLSSTLLAHHKTLFGSGGTSDDRHGSCFIPLHRLLPMRASYAVATVKGKRL
jgi:hypothetical protein